MRISAVHSERVSEGWSKQKINSQDVEKGQINESESGSRLSIWKDGSLRIHDHSMREEFRVEGSGVTRFQPY